MADYDVRVHAEYDKTLRPVELMAPIDELRMKYIFSEWLSDNALFDKFTLVPWLDLVSSRRLNRLYFGFHSGYKRPSPYLHNFLKEWVGGHPQYTITDEDMTAIAADIETLFSEKWERLYEMYMLEIDPMNNYHWKEIMSGEDVTADTGLVTTKFGQTVEVSGQGSKSNVRTGAVDTDTSYKGESTNTKEYSGKETIDHDYERNLMTGKQESKTNTNTRSGSVVETGATARYGFDSAITGEGEPYDRSAGNTKYNDLKDSSQATDMSTINETGTDNYDETKSFENRKDVETTTYKDRADDSTVTYKDLTDTGTSSNSESRTFGGKDDVTKTNDSNKKTSHEITVSGYKEVNYFEQLRKAFQAYETPFFNAVFKDIDSLLTISMY